MANYTPFDIEIKDIQLYNYNKSFIDIRHVMSEFNIYFDLLSNGIKCELLMSDSNGIIETLPIIGQETLHISFVTPTFENPISCVFSIYSITDRKKHKNQFETYTLHGISQEGINNYKRSVNKPYFDMTAASAVKKIYDDYLKPKEEDFGIIRKEKTFNIDETDGNVGIIFTGEKPLEAIKYLSNEAKARGTEESKASNFVFYEDADSWNFRTLDSFLSADAVQDFYLAEGANELTRSANPEDTIFRHQSISSLSYEKELDTVQNSKDGLYRHTIDIIDPILKRFTTEEFVYKNEFEQLSHVDKVAILRDDSPLNLNEESSKTYYTISNIGDEYATLAPDDIQLRNPRQIHKFLKYDIASRIQLNNIVVSVTVPGNTDLRLGNIVNLHIPQVTAVKEYRKNLNLLYDKRFMIMAIRHTYNKKDNTFFTTLECVKDSFAREPEEIK